jgi:hypothetical protein
MCGLFGAKAGDQRGTIFCGWYTNQTAMVSPTVQGEVPRLINSLPSRFSDRLPHIKRDIEHDVVKAD